MYVMFSEDFQVHMTIFAGKIFSLKNSNLLWHKSCIIGMICMQINDFQS